MIIVFGGEKDGGTSGSFCFHLYIFGKGRIVGGGWLGWVVLALLF
jgi:hypothetical protein